MSIRRATRTATSSTGAVAAFVVTLLSATPAASALVWVDDAPPAIDGRVGEIEGHQANPFVASVLAEADDVAPMLLGPPREATLSPGPASSFAAVSDPSSLVYPADVSGAVGLNQLMVATETDVRVQNKSGTVLSTVSKATFWSVAASGATVSYPQVLYDRFRGRWLCAALAKGGGATSHLLLAASQSSDATGQWTFYAVDLDPSDTSEGSRPHLGFNNNAIVAQVNMFNVSNDAFAGSQVYAFNKSAAYAGATAFYQLFTPNPDDYGGSQVPAITYDDYGSELLVQMWTSNGSVSGNGYLRLWALGGGPVGSAILAPGPLVGPFSAWENTPLGNVLFAPQLGSTDKFYLGNSSMQSVAYRNGTVWATHTVFLPVGAPTRSAVQWVQIDPSDGTILQAGRIDDADGTSPQMFYAFPSIAVNASDDVLIGYSRFSAQQFVSANYSFRRASDAPGTMEDERVLKAGEAPYSTGFTVWGYYSNTTVDPSNDHALWTVQEYAGTPSGGLPRWGTWWGRVFPPAPVVPTATSTGPTPTPTLTPSATPTTTATATETASPTPTTTATPGCGLAPETSCRTPAVLGKSTLVLKDKPDDAKDTFAWAWAKGSVTAKVEFGDPTATTHYDLCVYDALSALVMTASAPPGGLCGKKACWKPTKRGFIYANKALTPDGVQQLVLTDGAVPGKAKITAKGKGVNLDVPPLPLSPPIRVQLKSTSGVCWEATYSAPSKNDAGQFKAKADANATASASPVSSPTFTASATPASAQSTTPEPTTTPVPIPTLTDAAATPTPTTTITLIATATLATTPTLTTTPTPTTTATPAEHYLDNGDGTVTDNYTGLQWEKKDDTCPGIHCVNDPYDDAVFFAALNAGSGFAGHTDWRLPAAAELQSILLAPYPCGTSPCIDPVFGPTIASVYLAIAPPEINPLRFRLFVDFSDGYVSLGPAQLSTSLETGIYVRAVRTGP